MPRFFLPPRESFLCALLLLLWTSTTPAQQTPILLEANPLVRAQRMIDAGEPTAALELLSTLEAERAGEVEFDYLYGVAAVDSGQPALGVFALERAVANDPNFAGARVELARAYIALGERAAAEQELTTALGQNPPAKARRAIESYLELARSGAAIPAAGFKATNVTGYLEATAGWDSNANASTSDNGFLGFTLDETAVRASSPFLRGRGGVTVNHRVAQHWTLVGNTNLSHRHNPDASFIDTTQGDVYAGARYLDSQQLITFGVQGYRVNADTELNNQGGGLTAEWRFLVNERDHIALSGRVFAIRYAQLLKIQDVNQATFGLSFVHRFGDQGQRTLSMTALGGHDSATENDSPFDREFFGVRLFLGSALSETVTLSGSVGWLYSDYGGPFFGVQRTDNRYDGGVALEWRPWNDWIVRPELRYTFNESEVDLYQYDRFVGALTVRRDF